MSKLAARLQIRFLPLMLVLVGLLWTPTAVLAQATSPTGAEPGTVESEAAPQSSRPAYATLAEILEDDAAREDLIAELRRLAADGAEPSALQRAEDDVGVEVEPEDVTLSRRIALVTQSVAEGLAREFSDSVAALSAAGLSTLEVNWTVAGRHAFDIGIVLLATLAVFFVLRRLVSPIYARADRWAVCSSTGGSLLLHRSIAILGSGLLDLAMVGLAWVAGYILALFAFGEVSGAMDPRQTLFLNAFLLVESFKVLIRVLFAARYDALRLLPMGAESAAYWNAWFARLAGFIGYGLMLVVPLVSEEISAASGRVVTLLIMLMAFLYAWIIIRQNRDQVRGQMEAQAKEIQMTFGRVMLLGVARVWHWLALLYFAALGIVAMLRPEDALPFMVAATLQTLLSVGGGIFLAVVISQIMSHRISVPEETRIRFPLLEDRLNDSVPGVLRAVRIVILIAVGALVLDAWSVFNLNEWMASERGGMVLVTLATVGLIIVVAKAIWIGVASYVEHRLSPEAGDGEPTAREKTLLGLFRSAFAIVLATMTTMIVLSELGINIGPLIAGAGVIGLAVGFGSQKLVQDVITGVFIQLEQAINAGDVVTAGGITGVAEKVTIRSLRLRDLNGTYHVIPFSTVDKVSNFMRDFSCHVGEYGVAYREDTDEVIRHLQAAFEELVSNEEAREKIVGDLEVHGVTAFADSAVNVRVRFRTIPGAHWGLGRDYNRLVKRHFDAAGIEIPFPHMTVYFGEDKEGKAPPAYVRLSGGMGGMSVTQPDRSGGPAGGALIDQSKPTQDAPNTDGERS